MTRRRFPFALGLVALAACQERAAFNAAAGLGGPHFDVSANATCVVTSNADDGSAGTLRSKLADASCSTIAFDGPGTVQLTTGTLVVGRSVTITGPGADQVVIGRDPAANEFRVFSIASGATVSMSGVTITGGKATWGGGIENEGNLTLTDVVLTNNQAAGDGGGASNYGTMTIIGSTIANNTTGNGVPGGGGLFNDFGSTMRITNSTLSGNYSGWDGGAIVTRGRLEITHSTITNNRARYSGDGVYVESPYGGSLIMRSSIAAGNFDRDDIRGDATVTHSLIGNTSFAAPLTGTVENGNLTGTYEAPLNPMLGPLQINAPGATPTHALLFGSPAVNAGRCQLMDGAAITVDQRGVSRPVGSSCDMGAFELIAETLAPTVTITSPALNARYLLNSAVLAAFTCEDENGGSGIANCAGTVENGAPVNTTTVGSNTFAVQAVDRAGNVTVVSRTYDVTYNVTGFSEPVRSDALNGVKAGRAIPLRFSLGGAYGLGIVAEGFPASRPILCASASTAGEIEETTTAGASALSYDVETGLYGYVWKTEKSWGGTCRRLTLKLIDGSVLSADFSFAR